MIIHLVDQMDSIESNLSEVEDLCSNLGRLQTCQNEVSPHLRRRKEACDAAESAGYEVDSDTSKSDLIDNVDSIESYLY
ncbi:MAG: hypothetical protein GY811_11515 [Myxococcales bacterium]|nr:hypothetical protein [Myxococcales bacterium]